MPVNADQFEDLLGPFGVIGRDKDKPKRGLAAEFLTQLHRGVANHSFVKRTGDES